MTIWDDPGRHIDRAARARLLAWPARDSGAIVSAVPPVWIDRYVPVELGFDAPGRCLTRRNLTGASLPFVRRGVARSWQLLLAMRVAEARDLIEAIELRLDDVPAGPAARFRAAVHLLQAVSLVLQDDWLGANALANSANLGTGSAVTTLRRLLAWRLGQQDLFHALPRLMPHPRYSRRLAIAATIDLSIEAAAALDQLHLPLAERLAADAMAIAQQGRGTEGPAAFAACLRAQVLYEQGRLDEAEAELLKRLPIINAEAPVECGYRAYLVLARISRHRRHHEQTAMLLTEAELLGKRRGWPRLVAAALAEKVSLFLEAGRPAQACSSAESLDRYVLELGRGEPRLLPEIRDCRAAAWARLRWAEAPSMTAVAALRQVYHRALDRQDFYAGSRLAIELAGMLAKIEETERADDLLLQTLKSGAVAGLFQVFIERSAEIEPLLRRLYSRLEGRSSLHPPVLPLIGSLLSHIAARARAPAPSARPIGDRLSAREQDILERLNQGLSNKAIARLLAISPETVKSHVKRIFVKLAVTTRIEALSRGQSLGLL